MMFPKVQVIVLQYTNSNDTIKCLNSILGLNYPNFEIVIVDNASESEHVKKIEQFILDHPIQKLELQVSKHNLGYSGGNNLGIKYALKNNADYIWVLNNDTSVEINSLLKLVEAGEKNQKIGILSSILDEGNRKVYGGKIKWLKPELEHCYKLEAINPTLPRSRYKLNYMPGTAMLLRSEMVKKIGFLDERYFLYFEDAEYSMRAQRAGYKLEVVMESLVYHAVSSTTKKLGSPVLLRYHYRNAHIFNINNGPLWAKIILPFWSIFIIIKQLAKIIFIPAKRIISRAILMGVLDFYFGRYGKTTSIYD